MFYAEPQWRQKSVLFFLHVHKTAGTTFIEYLRQLYPKADTAPRDWPNNCRFSDDAKTNQKILAEMASSRLIHGHFGYDQVLNSLATVPIRLIFLRDPVERYISAFYHAQRPSPNPSSKVPLVKGVSMTELLDHPQLSLIQANVCTRLLCGIGLNDITTKYDVELAKERLSQFEFIGLTEEYALSLELFCHALAIAKPQIIESKNVGKNRLGEVSVSAELKAKIKQLNAADCELYELGKQLFEKQIQDYKINPPPTRDHFNVDFSTIPNGYGWYQQEKSRFGKYFCWSGPETCSNLFIPTLKPGQYQITFRASNSFKPELVKQITATWNDQPLELTMQKSTKTKSTFTSQVLIEDSPKSAFLRFFVPSTHKPSDFLSKSEDQRLLGCCFKDITITPL